MTPSALSFFDYALQMRLQHQDQPALLWLKLKTGAVVCVCVCACTCPYVSHRAHTPVSLFIRPAAQSGWRC